MGLTACTLDSWAIVKKDKVIWAYSLIPIVIGVGLYIFVGKFLYDTLMEWIKWASLRYAFTALFMVFLYFIISWSFVVIVSFLSFPFHDSIGHRAERSLLGEEATSRVPFRWVILREIKKMALILSLSALGLILSLFPLFSPISLILSGLLPAVSFVDYSWSRHGYGPSQCLRDMRKNFLPYTLSGFFLLGAVAIPFLGLLALPFSAVYFSVLFSRNREKAKISGHGPP